MFNIAFQFNEKKIGKTVHFEYHMIISYLYLVGPVTFIKKEPTHTILNELPLHQYPFSVVNNWPRLGK